MRAWSTLPRWARLVALAVGSRLLALGAMVAGSYWPRPTDDLHWTGHEGSLWFEQLPVRVLDVWGRWDTRFYWHIARFGYPQPGDDWVFHAAYFPLFPSLMRGLSRLLFGLEPYLAGLALSFAMFGLALAYLDKLVQLEASPQFAERVLLVLVCYPGTHFLTCVYPESTALFLAVFALYAARTGKPVVAGLACLLAAVTRSSGVFVAVPVAMELWRVPGRRAWALVALLPLLSLGAWLGLNWQLYDDPLYFVHVQAAWGRHAAFPLATLFTWAPFDHHLFALAGLALTVYAWRVHQRPASITLAGLNSLLPLSTGSLRGVHRYSASNWPLYVFAAQLVESRPWLLRAYVTVGLLTMTYFAFKWGQGYQPN